MTIHSGQELREAYQHRTWEYYRPVLAALVEFLPPGVILDVGAGTGLFVECCARLGLSCVGLEGALEGVAMAQARGIRLVAGRLELGLPFRDASFAAIVCNQVIEHLHDATADLVLRESHRVLVPGGVLMIQSPSPHDPEQRREPGHINLYTPSRVGAAARRRIQRGGPRVVPVPSGAHDRHRPFPRRDYCGGGAATVKDGVIAVPELARSR